MNAAGTEHVIAAVLASRSHEFSKLVRECGLSLRAFVHSLIHHAEDVAQDPGSRRSANHLLAIYIHDC